MITYDTGTPVEDGVYACRVPLEGTRLHEDIFLMWYKGKWSYMGSDMYYRNPVPYFVGPLQRRMP